MMSLAHNVRDRSSERIETNGSDAAGASGSERERGRASERERAGASEREASLDRSRGWYLRVIIAIAIAIAAGNVLDS